MSDYLGLILFAILAAAGWILSRRRPDIARRTARGLVVIPALILLVLTASGWSQSGSTAASIHGWGGHSLVIAMWLIVPYAMGVVVAIHAPKRPALALGMVILFLFALAVAFLASFMGYLDLTNAGEETKNRFVILHMYALPINLALSLALWAYLFRPSAHSEST